jgi:hypothetical protein
VVATAGFEQAMITRDPRFSSASNTDLKENILYETVFQIHEFLVRIQIRGSMPLTYGSGSCYFHLDLQDASKKLTF